MTVTQHNVISAQICTYNTQIYHQHNICSLPTQRSSKHLCIHKSTLCWLHFRLRSRTPWLYSLQPVYGLQQNGRLAVSTAKRIRHFLHPVFTSYTEHILGKMHAYFLIGSRCKWKGCSCRHKHSKFSSDNDRTGNYYKEDFFSKATIGCILKNEHYENTNWIMLPSNSPYNLLVYSSVKPERTVHVFSVCSCTDCML